MQRLTALQAALEICRRRSPEPRSECPTVGGRDEDLETGEHSHEKVWGAKDRRRVTAVVEELAESVDVSIVMTLGEVELVGVCRFAKAFGVLSWQFVEELLRIWEAELVGGLSSVSCRVVGVSDGGRREDTQEAEHELEKFLRRYEFVCRWVGECVERETMGGTRLSCGAQFFKGSWGPWEAVHELLEVAGGRV